MKTNPAVEGALRTLGILLLMTFLSWASVQANLSPIIGTTAAGLVTLIIGAIENYIKEKSGSALFGAIKVS